MPDVLVVNAGSTSMKLHLVDDDEHSTPIASFAEVPADVRVVAHRVVHGGARFREPVAIDDSVREAIRALVSLAPLHNAPGLQAIEEAERALPSVPHIAVFDTSFHSSIPEEAGLYAVPARWRDEWGIRRYGFHGLSVQWSAERVPELLGRPVDRLVVCHLGGGSSVTAVVGGRSVDTTMGFSPQSGLENATRHGDLDVFAVLYMMERHGWSTEDVRRQLAKVGGLAGLSGVDGGDVRDLESAAASGNRRAELALDVFVYQVKKTIGAFAAAMGGIDAVAFTGGIGENSARLRERCCEGLEFLGICIDTVRNSAGSGDRPVSADDSRVTVLALSTNEELVVARRAYRALTQ